MKYLMLILCSGLFTSVVTAQEKITGKIVDLKNKPVAFAHIYFSEKVGTISNDSGYFQLKIKHQTKPDDSLSISSIGFKGIRVNVNDYNNLEFLAIRLIQKSRVLKPVTITSNDNNVDSAYILVKTAIDKIVENYPVKKHTLHVFYREATITDTVYSRLSETLALVNSPSYRKSIDELKIEVKSIRKTQDKRKLDWRESLTAWLYKKNGIYTTLQRNRLRIKSRTFMAEYYENKSLDENSESRFFNKHFLTHTSFTLKNEYVNNQDTIYRITYVPTVKSKYLSANVKATEGELHINKKDLAIVEIISTAYCDNNALSIYHLDGKHKNEFSKCWNCQSKKNRVINDSIYNYTYIKYQKHKDHKYYPKVISYKSNTGHNSESMLYSEFNQNYLNHGKIGNLYIHNELYVLDILPWRKIKRKNTLSKSEEIHELEKTGTWDKVNLPLISPLNEKMKKDLSQNDKLFE